MNNFTLSLLEQQIKTTPQVLLLTHQDPDEDALGAIMALYELAERWGGRPSVCLSGKVDQNFKHLEKVLPPHKIELANFGAITIVDTIYPARTGISFPKDLSKAPKIFIIDHHILKETLVYPKNFSLIVRSEATASCEIIYDLIKEKGEKISSQMAFNLLLGIYADSGGFSHSNTTPSLLKKSKELLKKGVVFKNIIQSSSKGKQVRVLNFWGEKINNSYFNHKLKFISSWFTKKEFEEKNIPPEEISGLVNLLNMCREAKFSLFLKEEEDGKIKGSLRSSEKKEMNVNILSHLFSGGGHRLAAGFEVKGKFMEKEGKIQIKPF
ncbi:MAG: bifunctional oligoribonuclease/PAP phosphatase NrnA [Candidatus Moranbacteria bacterium]|nr:bifunctional oligoribonuclease/PAP phosphatase NrnA [Candidatus Moranbacteria bacterium]